MSAQGLADRVNALPPGKALRVAKIEIESLRGGGLYGTVYDDLMEKIIGSKVGTVEVTTDPMSGAVTFYKTNI